MAATDDAWQKVKLVSTLKTVKDMTASVPLKWTGEKLSNFYRTFHKQNNDSAFPKAFNLVLLGKSLASDVRIADILNGRVLANEIKIYVLPDRGASSSASRSDPNMLKNLSSTELEAVQIVEANQSFTLLSEYIGSLLAAYDPLSQAETRQIILKNFPLMDPRIQSLVLKCSKFYGATCDNPFVDENVTKLMDALGIQPQTRDPQAIRELFKWSPEAPRREVRPEVEAQPVPDRAEEVAREERQNRDELNQFIEEQLNRQQPQRGPGNANLNLGEAQVNQ